MDRLEEYIRKNREGLDKYSPSSGVWRHIRRETGHKSSRLKTWLSIAAMIVVIVAGAVFVGKNVLSGHHGTMTANGNIQEIRKDTQLNETEIYYNNLVNSLYNEAKPFLTGNPEIQKELTTDFSHLDSICSDIRKDLKDNVANQEVVEALIRNYRIKIRLLEDMLATLKENKNNPEKKKTMNCKTFISLNLVLFIFASLSAQNDSETRSFIKSYAVDKETSLEISNKYGTIQITSWNKDSVYIRAEVKAYASNQSKLTKMFDGITVNFNDTKYLVRAQTEFTTNINMLFESFKGMTSKLISYDSRVEINYFINMPEYLNLKIDNKYGDVYMEDLTGDLSLSLSNGSFKANSLDKASSMSLVFCDAKIKSLLSGKIDANFSDITINESNDLNINSISSKFDIKHSGLIRVESRRDKFFIGTIDNLQGNSYFTDFRLNNLRKETNISTRYGSFNADLIEKGFETVTINSGYSDISLGFDSGASYNMDIRCINAFLILPDKNIKTEEKALNEEKKEYITYGTVGKNPGSSKVKIDATRGNIYLK